jgi:quercetin dioxygenase-like cupin family protein
MERSFETGRIRESGWTPIRREVGAQAFGVNAWTADAGEAVIPEHDEAPSGHEELYVVTTGRAAFTVGDDAFDAPVGTMVFVPDPAARRGAVAMEAGTTVLAVGGKPGEAYRPRSWETNAEAMPLWEAGDFAGIKRLMLDALERYEDRGVILFNLACAEAQLGEADAALEHLAAAVAEEPRLADNAREDADLDPIRDDPRFPA